MADIIIQVPDGEFCGEFKPSRHCNLMILGKCIYYFRELKWNDTKQTREKCPACLKAIAEAKKRLEKPDYEEATKEFMECLPKKCLCYCDTDNAIGAFDSWFHGTFGAITKGEKG